MKTKIYSVFLSLFLFSGFLQAQSITVLTPVSGASWARGETKTITWNQSQAGINVNITLQGASTKTIVSNYTTIDAGDKSYTWNIPYNLPTGTYTMTIANSGTPSINGTSSFTIAEGPAYVFVLTPNGGESWLRGGSYNITWEDNLTSAVRIELFTADMSTVVQSISGWAEGTSFVWTIPNNVVPGSYRIRIANSSNPIYCLDFSDAAFTISTATGTVTLTTPATGSSYPRNSILPIAWSTQLGENVKVELFNPNNPYAGGGTGYELLAYTLSGTTLNWWIPSYMAPSTGYKIKVSSFLSPASYAENTFTITTRAPGGVVTLTSPDPYAVTQPTWIRNSANVISWTDNLDENVIIELQKVGSATWQPLTWATGGNSWSWWIPYYQEAGEYIIRVSSTLDASVNTYKLAAPGITFAYKFKIAASGNGGTGTVTLTTPPVTPTPYPRSSLLSIKWTKTFSENVKVELYNPFGTGTGWELLDWSNGGSQLDWWIPSYMTPATNYKIRVSNVSTGAASSTHTFTISASAPGGIVTMTTPVALQTWVRNTPNTISWEKNFNEDVRIELQKSGTSTWNPLTWATGGYSWSWWIPYYQEAGDYFLKLSSTLAPADVYTVVAFKIATFGSSGTVTITNPADGVTPAWACNSTQTIEWQKNFTQDVKIELIKSGSTNTETITWSTGYYSFVWWVPYWQATGLYNIKVSNTVTGASDTHTITITANSAGGGTVSITNPVGHGTQTTWGCNTTHLLGWQKNFPEDVRIEMRKSGSTTTETITWATEGTTFSWWIPNYQETGTYSITVSSILSGASDTHSITISANTAGGGTVSITNPVGHGAQTIWARNTTKLLAWQKDFPEDVKIELAKSGSTVTETLTWATEGNTFSWWIPYFQEEGNYDIKVSSTLTGASDTHTITIAATAAGAGIVTITTPTHGVTPTWYLNEYRDIIWQQNFDENVKIELKKTSASSYQTLTWSTSGTSFNWWIPTYQDVGDYNIKVSSTVTGVSDTHTITLAIAAVSGICTVTSPNGGEWWGIGTNKPITWSKTFSDNVKIELKKVGGPGGVGDWETIIWSAGGLSYSWWIENWRLQGKYIVRISNVNSSIINDVSDDKFNLEIYDLMTYPNPVISTLTLKADVFTQSNCAIEVYNHFGTKLLTRKVELQSSDEYTLSLDGFVNDVYYVVVTGNGRRISKSIIVQH